MSANVEWRDIAGYEGMYRVSSDGAVLSIGRHDLRGSFKRERILKASLNHGGYKKLLLYKDGIAVPHRVHRLVADAFLPNPAGLPQVNHKNGIRTDNRVENLEWCTASENTKHGYDVLGNPGPWFGKLGADHHRSKPVIATSLQTGETVSFGSAREACRKLGLSHSVVGDVCRGRKARTQGWVFRYAQAVA